jgi:hypothetical protein
MSFGEKRWWTYAAVVVVVPAIYFAVVLGQLGRTPVKDIDFQAPLLAAIAVGVGLGVVTQILLRIGGRITSPTRGPEIDQRDRDINRLGEYVGGVVLAIGMVAPFGLALLRAESFWIANAMYVAFSVAAFAASVVKLVLYRHGI